MRYIQLLLLRGNAFSTERHCIQETTDGTDRLMTGDAVFNARYGGHLQNN